MSYDEKLANRIRKKLSSVSPVEEKKMMGGLCFMYNGKMCAGIFKNELMCRIDPEKLDEALKKPGSRQMEMGGRLMKGFVLVSNEGINPEKNFDYWINLCLAFNPNAKAAKNKSNMKHLFLFLTLFFSVTAGAQDRFIEVTVSDTVMIKSDYFIYRLQLLRDAYTTDWVPDTVAVNLDENPENERRLQANRAFDSLVNALRNEGFAIMPRTLPDSFTVSDRFNDLKFVRLFTRSTDTLTMIFEKAKSLHFITCMVETLKASNEKTGYDRLYRKLLDDAAARAAFIASHGKQKLGRMLSVRELQVEQTDAEGWTTYPPLSALGPSVPGWHTSSPYESDGTPNAFGLYPLQKTFVIRYALN